MRELYSIFAAVNIECQFFGKIDDLHRHPGLDPGSPGTKSTTKVFEKRLLLGWRSGDSRLRGNDDYMAP